MKNNGSFWRRPFPGNLAVKCRRKKALRPSTGVYLCCPLWKKICRCICVHTFAKESFIVCNFILSPPLQYVCQACSRITHQCMTTCRYCFCFQVFYINISTHHTFAIAMKAMKPVSSGSTAYEFRFIGLSPLCQDPIHYRYRYQEFYLSNCISPCLAMPENLSTLPWKTRHNTYSNFCYHYITVTSFFLLHLHLTYFFISVNGYFRYCYH